MKWLLPAELGAGGFNSNASMAENPLTSLHHMSACYEHFFDAMLLAHAHQQGWDAKSNQLQDYKLQLLCAATAILEQRRSRVAGNSPNNGDCWQPPISGNPPGVDDTPASQELLLMALAMVALHDGKLACQSACSKAVYESIARLESILLNVSPEITDPANLAAEAFAWGRIAHLHEDIAWLFDQTPGSAGRNNGNTSSRTANDVLEPGVD